jgi:hypothetical protein
VIRTALPASRLPGGALLHNIQVQLADDSFHAVRIALREKILEIVRVLDRVKSPCRRDVSGPVVLLREGWLAKFLEELVEAI